jgi:hypothetical protein
MSVAAAFISLLIGNMCDTRLQECAYLLLIYFFFIINMNKKGGLLNEGSWIV